MSQSVVWSSCQRLSCAYAQSPTVVLCLTSSDLVNSEPCVRSTIEATLTKVWKDGSACGIGSFRYLFSYDENQLADPDTPLTTAQISGVFCMGCLTTWIIDEINCAIAEALD